MTVISGVVVPREGFLLSKVSPNKREVHDIKREAGKRRRKSGLSEITSGVEGEQRKRKPANEEKKIASSSFCFVSSSS
jgi:hypothetical protein